MLCWLLLQKTSRIQPLCGPPRGTLPPPLLPWVPTTASAWSPYSQPVLQSQLFSAPVRSCHSFPRGLPVLPPHARQRPGCSHLMRARGRSPHAAPPPLHPSVPFPLLLLLHAQCAPAQCAPTWGRCRCWSSEICKRSPSPLPSLLKGQLLCDAIPNPPTGCYNPLALSCTGPFLCLFFLHSTYHILILDNIHPLSVSLACKLSRAGRGRDFGLCCSSRTYLCQ